MKILYHIQYIYISSHCIYAVQLDIFLFFLFHFYIFHPVYICDLPYYLKKSYFFKLLLKVFSWVLHTQLFSFYNFLVSVIGIHSLNLSLYPLHFTSACSTPSIFFFLKTFSTL